MNATLSIGVAGLGRAFSVMLPTFVHDPRVQLVAAADPSPAARARFGSDFGAPAYDSVEALCADPKVQLVYVATPHQLHCRHVCMAAGAGKHVLVEKPMAITLDECSAMVDACRDAGVHLIVGHSHSFNLPILHTRALINSGRYGRVRMIVASDYTDFLYRPRRPEELDTRAGGGVVFSQGAHQIDIVRLLGGGLVRSVRAFTGAWDALRPTEGAYSALLGFEDGAFCSASYSGYAHYDSDEQLEGIGENGQPKVATDYGAARRRIAQTQSAEQEAALKSARNYGGERDVSQQALPSGSAHLHFGPIVVSCEGADLRPTARGVAVYADRDRHVEWLSPPSIARAEVIDEIHGAVMRDRPPLHDGAWARATTEVCLAILDSAHRGIECPLRWQVAPGRQSEPAITPTSSERPM